MKNLIMNEEIILIILLILLVIWLVLYYDNILNNRNMNYKIECSINKMEKYFNRLLKLINKREYIILFTDENNKILLTIFSKEIIHINFDNMSNKISFTMKRNEEYYYYRSIKCDTYIVQAIHIDYYNNMELKQN